MSVIKDTIENLPITYDGGTSFLSFIKLILAKLRGKDWTSFDKQFIQLNFEKIKNQSDSAINAGILSYKKDEGFITKGIYQVNASNENDLRILGEIDDDLIDVSTFTSDLIENHLTKANLPHIDETDTNTAKQKLKIILNQKVMLDDRGLILDLRNVERWLFKQFESNIEFMNRTHDNHKQAANLFSVLMQIIFKRREYRVLKWLDGNLNGNDSTEAKKLKDSINRSLKTLKVQLSVQTCAQTCTKCKYSCLRNHSNPGDQMIHDCFGDHKCKIQCERCNHICTHPSGHSGIHVCDSRDKKHCCNEICSLDERCKCKGRCNLKPGHSENNPHMCGAVHFCNKQCHATWKSQSGQEIQCQDLCKVEYDATKGDIRHIHDCKRNQCLFTCSVICRTEVQDGNGNKWVIDKCKRQCGCKNHFHDQIIRKKLKTWNGINISVDIGKYKMHCCGETHKCAEKCEIGATRVNGNEPNNDKLNIKNRDAVCQWKVSTKYDTKKYENSNGDFYYPEWNVPESIIDWCEHLIPEFEQNHLSTKKKHACGVKRDEHRCTKQCAACRYNCIKPFGHCGLHKAIHGNMMNSVFLASNKDAILSIRGTTFNKTVEQHNNVVVTELKIPDDQYPDDNENNENNSFDANAAQVRGYNVGDSANAELCNLFCLTHGRGHIHLKRCAYHYLRDQCNIRLYKDKNDTNKGTKQVQRHSNMEIDIKGHSIKHACDELTHSYYWETMLFEDPVRDVGAISDFDKCNFECLHYSHQKKNEKVYCTLDLWHQRVTQEDINKIGKKELAVDGHAFNCTHPTNEAPHMLSLMDMTCLVLIQLILPYDTVHMIEYL